MTSVPGLLFVTGGNIDTLSNVMWALRIHVRDCVRLQKVVVLDLADGGRSVDAVPIVERVRLILGPSSEVRFRHIRDDPQTAIARLVVDGARELGRDALVVDLTTGNKTTSAILYACASFSQLHHLYYVSVHQRTDSSFPRLWEERADDTTTMSMELYDVAQLPTLREVKELTAQSYFDLIYYADQLDTMDATSPANIAASVRQVTNQLRSCLPLFFGNPPQELAAMRVIGVALESALGLLRSALALAQPAPTQLPRLHASRPTPPGKKGQTDAYSPAELYKALDMGANQLRKLARCSGTGASFVKQVPGILTIDALASVVHWWRNAASHPDPPEFGLHDVRVALLVTLHMLQTAIAVHSLRETTDR